MPTAGLSMILHADGEPNLLTWTDRPVNAVAGKWDTNASFAVVSSKWIITTRHQNSCPATVNINGINYKCIYNSQWVGGPTGLVDIRLIRLKNADDSDPNLAYAPPYTDGNEVNQNICIGGYGKYRGNTLYSHGQGYGYLWAGSCNTLRWGQNIINGTGVSQYVGSYYSDTLDADFDLNGRDYEAAPAMYDSGGGWFIKQNGIWKLAALSASVERVNQTWFDDPNTENIDPDNFWGIRVSSYAAWINKIITDDCPAGDIDGNCKVDMFDVVQLTDWWLHTNCASGNSFCQWADIQPDGKVNMLDWAILAENWFEDKSQ